MSDMGYHYSKEKYRKFRGGETKIMKKILSVALSTAMAFSMFSSVALGAPTTPAKEEVKDLKKLSTEEKYKIMEEEGIFNGDGKGNAMLDDDMTREQLAKILVLTFGLTPIEGKITFKDKGYNEGRWSAKYIEAVAAAGMMEGKGNNIFDLAGKVTVEELATVFVRALQGKGVEEVKGVEKASGADWSKNYVEAAIKLDVVSSTLNKKSKALRRALVEAAFATRAIIETPTVVSVSAVDANTVKFVFSDKEEKTVKLDKALEPNKETTVEIEYKGKKYTEKVTYAVDSATKVTKVEADNLKEVRVTFDGQVDEATATVVSNYTLSGVKFVKATLADSKNEVVLLIDENTPASSFKKNVEYKLTVRNVKNSDKSKSINVDKYAFKPYDNIMPVVKKVEALGTKAVKVTFSEPVKRDSAMRSANYKVDGKSVTFKKYAYPNVVILSAQNSTGEHTLKVENVRDFADNAVTEVENTFTAAEDTEAPKIVKITSKDLKTAVIEFDEPVESVGRIYLGSVYYTAQSKTIEDNKITVDFGNRTLAYNSSVINVENVTDYSGNRGNAQGTVEVVADNSEFEVTDIKVEKVGNSHHIKIELNREVDKNDAKRASSYNLKKVDGRTAGKGFDYSGVPRESMIATSDTKDGRSTITIKTLGGLLEKGDYTLTIQGLRDRGALAGLKQLGLRTETFTIKDTQDFKVKSAWVANEPTKMSDGKYEGEIMLRFSKEVYTGSEVGNAEDTSKYGIQIKGQPLKNLSQLENSSVAKEGDNLVRLTIPGIPSNPKVLADNAATEDFVIYVYGIKDVDGNALVPENNAPQGKVVVGKKETLKVDSVKATGTHTFEATFSDELDTVESDDFRVGRITTMGTGADAKKVLIDQRHVFQGVNDDRYKDSNKSIVTFRTEDPLFDNYNNIGDLGFYLADPAATTRTGTAWGASVAMTEPMAFSDEVAPRTVDFGSGTKLAVALYKNTANPDEITTADLYLKFNKEISLGLSPSNAHTALKIAVNGEDVKVLPGTVKVVKGTDLPSGISSSNKEEILKFSLDTTNIKKLNAISKFNDVWVESVDARYNDVTGLVVAKDQPSVKGRTISITTDASIQLVDATPAPVAPPVFVAPAQTDIVAGKTLGYTFASTPAVAPAVDDELTALSLFVKYDKNVAINSANNKDAYKVTIGSKVMDIKEITAHGQEVEIALDVTKADVQALNTEAKLLNVNVVSNSAVPNAVHSVDVDPATNLPKAATSYIATATDASAMLKK